jgi:hypothetical protein
VFSRACHLSLCSQEPAIYLCVHKSLPPVSVFTRACQLSL